MNITAKAFNAYLGFVSDLKAFSINEYSDRIHIFSNRLLCSSHDLPTLGPYNCCISAVFNKKDKTRDMLFF